MAGDAIAVAAARNFRSLRRRGITVRKTIDLLIGKFVSRADPGCGRFPESVGRSKTGWRRRLRNPQRGVVETWRVNHGRRAAEGNVFEHQAPGPNRGEVLARYRHLREISKRHHSKVLDFLSHDAMLHHARRLGLAVGRTLILDSIDELTLAFDLAIHTAPVGRSRAIDRYARSAQLASGSDEARVLDAMCNARFAVLLIQRRHQAAGLLVTDLFRKAELWLVDEGLEISLPTGTLFATRYYTPDRFSLTAGVGLPVDSVVLTSALELAPQLLRRSRAEAIEDRRFAEAVYRAAIADGIMEGISYQDPAVTSDAA